MSDHKNFYERYAAGLVRELTREFDEAVGEWHDADTDLSVWEWLGITEESYTMFVENTRQCRCSECRWRRSPW